MARNRREQAPKEYNRGRSNAYTFDKRAEFHSTRAPRGSELEQAIAEDLAAWGYEDTDDILADA